MHGRDCEVAGTHLLSEPIDLPLGVDEDDILSCGQDFVTQCPVFIPRSSVMWNTLQGQFFLLDKNPDKVPHEFIGHFEHVGRHGSQQLDQLGFAVELLEYVIDLVLESMA